MIESNISEVLAGLKARQAKVDAALQKTAMQMGVVAKSTTDPITPYLTGNLQGTVHPEVSQIGPGVWLLWFRHLRGLWQGRSQLRGGSGILDRLLIDRLVLEQTRISRTMGR
jgi:hypothetical protein